MPSSKLFFFGLHVVFRDPGLIFQTSLSRTDKAFFVERQLHKKKN